MASKQRTRITTALKILVAVGLIVALVKSGQLDPAALLHLMTPRNVLLAVILTGLNLYICAWRWAVLLRSRGFHITMSYGFSLHLIALFFNYALPGSVGGDVVKGYYLVSDYPERKMDGVLSVLLDRIFGLYTYFVITIVAIACEPQFFFHEDKIRVVTLSALVIFAAMTLFFAISFSERLHRWSGVKALLTISDRFKPIHNVFEALQRFGKNRKMICNSMLISLFAQVFTMLFFYVLALEMHEPGITWMAVLFAVPLGFVVSAIPISPAGIGVGQVAFQYLFQTYLGHTTQFGSLSITAFQLTSVLWAMVGAVLYIRRSRPRELVKANAHE